MNHPNVSAIIAPVSAIIPCHKCATTIRRSVDSVARQSVLPSELILIDDGSSDGTLEVLRQLQNEFGEDWIKVIALPKNYGAAHARNLGWDQAQGEYIAFLDADDVWHNRKIEIQYQWMSKNPEIVFSGHKSRIYVNEVASYTDPLPIDYSIRQITKRQLMLSNPFVTPSFMIKQSLPVRFNARRRYTEDFLLVMEIGLSGYKIYRIGLELAFIYKRLGKSGVSANLWKMRAADFENYYFLWKNRKISFWSMLFFLLYSFVKHIILITIGYQQHYKFRKLLEQ